MSGTWHIAMYFTITDITHSLTIVVPLNPWAKAAFPDLTHCTMSAVFNLKPHPWCAASSFPLPWACLGPVLGEPLYCITPALDGCLSHLDRIPHTWTMTSFNICSTILYKYDILALIHHYSFCLICFCLSWPPMDHIIGSFPQRSVDIHMSHGLCPICSPNHCREKRWNEEKSKTNEVLKGDKVPLGDNRSATHGNCT